MLDGIRRGLANKWLGAGGASAPSQQDVTARYGGRFSRRTVVAMATGQHEGKQLFAEIRQLGYVGSYASLMRLLEPPREAQGAVGKAPQ